MARAKRRSGSFQPGDKVRYRHGRGLSTGTLVEVNEEKGWAKIETKNGSHTGRQLDTLEPYTEPGTGVQSVA